MIEKNQIKSAQYYFTSFLWTGERGRGGCIPWYIPKLILQSIKLYCIKFGIHSQDVEKRFILLMKYQYISEIIWKVWFKIGNGGIGNLNLTYTQKYIIYDNVCMSHETGSSKNFN